MNKKTIYNNVTQSLSFAYLDIKIKNIYERWHDTEWSGRSLQLLITTLKITYNKDKYDEVRTNVLRIPEILLADN